MLLLPFELFSLLLFIPLVGSLLFALEPVGLAFGLEVVFLLGPQIREFLNFGLVETIDDGIQTRWYMHLLDHLLVVKRDLTGCHGRIFTEVRPGCIDDGNIVLLVSW